MIIGFVASFLYREDEKGRVSAARCLEAIAGLVPRASRDAFLAANKDPSASASDESTSPDSAQFLDVGPMVVDNCRIFELVLSKGMELNSRDWEDPDIIRRAIEVVKSPQERIRIQREILLYRLGMSMKSGHEALDHTKALASLISSSDISSSPTPPPTKKQKKTKKKDDELGTPQMALLLMQTMEQQTTAASASSSSASHLLPQALLATDITFNMFSPNWHIRHGAVMGMLHLLKAWTKVSASPSSAPTPGLWIKDILCRTLCLLTLDRFGDYTSPHKTIHPVRESAGQLLAFLGTLCDKSEVSKVVSALAWMRTASIWEVRHGSCVGFKYLKLTLPDLLGVCRPTLTSDVIASLLDSSDDVKMGAAQALVGMMMLKSHSNDIPTLAFKNAWNALLCTDEMSSHATDLLKLISLISRAPPGMQLIKGVDSTALFRFLDHSSSSVQIEGMKLLTSILNSVDLAPCFIATLTQKVFVSSRSNHQIEGAEGRRLNAARTGAFEVAVSKLKERGGDWDGRQAFVKNVVVSFFAPEQRSKPHTNLSNTMKLHSQGFSPQGFNIIVRSAKFLSLLHSALGFEVHSFASIKVFLSSPFMQDVEAAVILYDKMTTWDAGLDEAMTTILTSTAPHICLLNGVDRGEKYFFRLVESIKSEVPVPLASNVPSAVQESSSPTIQQVRLNSLVTTAYVKKAPKYPDKLSKVLQTFMTAVKYERDGQRRHHNSDGLAFLVARLLEENEERHRNALAKVVKNILFGAANGVENASLCVAMLGKRFRGDIFSRIDGLRSGVLDLLSSTSALANPGLVAAVKLLNTFVKSLDGGGLQAITEAIPTLTCSACSHVDLKVRELASSCVVDLVGKSVQGDDGGAKSRAFTLMLPTLRESLRCDSGDRRESSLSVLLNVMIDLGVNGRFFVIDLLPIAMSFMSDEYGEVGKFAANIFSTLIRVAPLVVLDEEEEDDASSSKERKVVRHLVHGLPLPKLEFSSRILKCIKGGLVLRPYQEEGVSWVDFLFSVGLNGVLSDEMGLGKTVQTLVAIAMRDEEEEGGNMKSLIVCPSTLCSHWISETKRFFDESLFRPLLYTGSAVERKRLREGGAFTSSNIVVTSYAVMRSDVELLAKHGGLSVLVLDEGHLLKNPNTATAKAARRLRARHKLILTGTPVQNRVEELWATFDFLMPSFLGSAKKFMRDYGKIIGDSLSEGEKALMGGAARGKLKALHQQVLPFILRREKKDVLKELPEKIVTDVSCELSPAQRILYNKMLVHIKKRVKGGVDGAKGGEEEGNVLKYLLYLRLLCVHPILVAGKGGSGGGTDKKDEDEDDDEDIFGSKDRKNRYSKLEDSGKLSVLMELLVSSGIVADDRVTAADADTSSIFVDVDTVEGIMDIEDEENEKPGEEGEDGQEENKEEVEEDEVVDGGALDAVRKRRDGKPNKCLIFAQHTKALDVVEEYLFRPHLPSLNYLRLDGRKPANKRFEISEAFNRDDDIRVLLLTTKIGGLGLNLTGANVVIFLEHDYNPVNDLQAMDRAHRIGQKECVSVYRLVTRNSIDERIMASQRAKVAMGDAIVTSDNSSMFAMGTERLLDLFDLEEVEEVGNAGVEEGVVDELWAGMKDEDRIVEEERGDFDHLNVESFMDEREESVKG